jgi:hypothetical protein
MAMAEPEAIRGIASWISRGLEGTIALQSSKILLYCVYGGESLRNRQIMLTTYDKSREII